MGLIYFTIIYICIYFIDCPKNPIIWNPNREKKLKNDKESEELDNVSPRLAAQEERINWVLKTF